MRVGGMPHIIGKLSMQVKILLEISHELEVCTRSYGRPMWWESQFQELGDSQFGSPKEKCHLDVTPMACHKEYYKGEGGGFPQVWVMVSIVSLCMPMVNLCTKNVPTMH
jgi:hypothetical protein